MASVPVFGREGRMAGISGNWDPRFGSRGGVHRVFDAESQCDAPSRVVGFDVWDGEVKDFNAVESEADVALSAGDYDTETLDSLLTVTTSGMKTPSARGGNSPESPCSALGEMLRNSLANNDTSSPTGSDANDGNSNPVNIPIKRMGFGGRGSRESDFSQPVSPTAQARSAPIAIPGSCEKSGQHKRLQLQRRSQHPLQSRLR